MTFDAKHLSLNFRKMKPLIVLIAVFVFSSIIIKLIYKEYRFSLSGRIAMAAMLLFTALGHFVFSKGMAMMIPDFLPYKTGIVYITGIFEIVLATGLLLPQYHRGTGWALIIFLLLVLPANIYAAVHQVDYQNATFNGPGMNYLWLRVPAQILYIAWAYVFAVRR